MGLSSRILLLVSLLWCLNLRARDLVIPVAGASSAHPVKPARLYGALDNSLKHAATGYDIGWRVAIISIRWDKFEPQRGVINQAYVKEIMRKKLAFRKLGYKLQVDFGVQYPPKWVFELPHGRYRDQYGDYFSTKASGEDLPNVVFNNQVRSAIAFYFHQVFARLGDDWTFIRLGCAKYGELNYPQDKYGGHTNCYWAFGELAQGKTAGLPPGMPPCPVPGWIPGTPSPLHESAKAFVNWYLGCLENYQNWQIKTVRHWYKGDICMLYGSTGLRPGWINSAIADDLSGATSPERNGEIQQGYDWSLMISSLRDPKVIVYCTWIDGTIRNHNIFDDNSPNPDRWSPVHWLTSLARANPIRLRVWGENTGRNNLAAMRLTFQYIKQYKLMGIMWAFEPDLFLNADSNKYATFAEYAEFIKKYR